MTSPHSEDRNQKPVDSGEVNRNRVTEDRIEDAARELGAREGGIYWSQLLPILQRLYDDGKKAGAEEMRETNTALNRRATRAEAIVAQRVEEQERKGKSLGRSLANAGYYSLKAENQRLREAATEAEWCLSVHATCDCGQDIKLRAVLESK